MPAAGLTASNRAVLAQLRRSFAGPFTTADASSAAGIEPARASRLLRHLVDQGWLTRVQRGLYAAVPLEAEDPAGWRVDPWTIAAKVLAPAYIGGWTALHHWDLTDQLFATTVAVTARPVARKERTIGGARFRLRHRPSHQLFGLRRVWRDGLPVDVSDPERTLVDCLDDPSLGGGVRHLSEAVVEWDRSDRADSERLLGYAERLGNHSVYKRLGFIVERLGIAPELAAACVPRISRGVSLLDPERPAAGPIVTRWNIRVNASIES